jgi:hypothetical protein
MNENLQKLIAVLCELRTASINSSSENIRTIMQKYNMLFLGSKFNTIYSVELHNSLNTIFDFNIDFYELNVLIPTACNTLNMSFEKLIAIEDIGKPNPAINYQIILW